MSTHKSKPMSDEQLSEAIKELIWYELGDGLNATDVDEATESLLTLITTQKKAWGNYVIGEDERNRKRTHILVQDEAPRIRNQLRQELRTAIKGEEE